MFISPSPQSISQTKFDTYPGRKIHRLARTFRRFHSPGRPCPQPRRLQFSGNVPRPCTPASACPESWASYPPGRCSAASSSALPRSCPPHWQTRWRQPCPSCRLEEDSPCRYQSPCWLPCPRFLFCRPCRCRILRRQVMPENQAARRSFRVSDHPCRLLRSDLQTRRSAPFPQERQPLPAPRFPNSGYSPSLHLSDASARSLSRQSSSVRISATCPDL